MVCSFMVDRIVMPDKLSVQVHGALEGRDSALINALFQIPGVSKVYCAGTRITVTKSDEQPWTDIGKKIGAAIRSTLQGSTAPFSEELIKTLRDGDAKDDAEKMRELFTQRINPELASHGGFVELVRILNRDVYLRMGGGCQGCASSLVTLKQGIEKEIRKVFPDVREIIDDTDHASGANPYYK